MVKRLRSIRLPEELEQAVLRLADEEDRSFSNAVTILVREALQRRGIEVTIKKKQARPPARDSVPKRRTPDASPGHNSGDE